MTTWNPRPVGRVRIVRTWHDELWEGIVLPLLGSAFVAAIVTLMWRMLP